MKKKEMSNKIRKLASMLKAGDAMVVNYDVPFIGKLKIDRKKGDEWGFLEIDKKIVDNIFNALDIPDGFEKPDYKPHVSVFSEDEVKNLPKDVEEEGKEFAFTMENIASVDPYGWDNVDDVLMIQIDSPELEKLRAKYGFSKKMNQNKHEFHITLAVSNVKEASKYTPKRDDIRGLIAKISKKVDNNDLDDAFSTITTLEYYLG